MVISGGCEPKNFFLDCMCESDLNMFFKCKEGPGRRKKDRRKGSLMEHCAEGAAVGVGERMGTISHRI